MTRCIGLMGLFVVLRVAACQEPPIQDLNVLIGKQVIVRRTALSPPGTFTWSLAYAGKQATVVSLKPSKALSLTPAVMNKLSPAARAILEDQQKAATILVRFEDGTQLDSCMPITPRVLSDHFELAPGQTLDAAPASTPVPVSTPVQAANPLPATLPLTTTAPPFPAQPPKRPSETRIGPHLLGETFQEWLTINEFDLADICGKQKLESSRRAMGTKSYLGEGKGACKKFQAIQTTGSGWFQIEQPRFRWRFIGGRAAEVEATYGRFDGGAAKQLQFLSETYGEPTTKDIAKYQNAYCASWDCAEASWDMPDRK